MKKEILDKIQQLSLSDLKNKQIKTVFYQDEFGGSVTEDNDSPFHFIQYGSIFLEFDDKSLIEIFNDDEGITVLKVIYLYIQELKDYIIEKDKCWSTISNKKISAVNTFKSTLLISRGKNSKLQEKEVISTIELIFKNQEHIYISNAGYRSKDEIVPMTDDFIVYRKRKIGQELKIMD